MSSPRVFVPVVCIALLVACTSQEEASTSRSVTTDATRASSATEQTNGMASSSTGASATISIAAPSSNTPPSSNTAQNSNVAAPTAVAAPVAAPVAPDAPHSTVSAETRGLFATFCAACHGATGDGNGTTKLDRPARSFKDGGFSYGNTPDAIAKTLAYGIPGSVMPSFGKSLSDEQRIALAKYVIELGPQDMPTESPDRVMVVSDRAVVARGKLPPIVEGGEEIPRGLLVGTPDGFTFAYRTDDLRLIAVYQGEFAERTDWMGRGGTQLKPLGKLVASYGKGAPDTAFRDDMNEERSMRTRFVGTELRGRDAVVVAEVLDMSGSAPVAIARIEETPRASHSSIGTGWRRHFRIRATTDRATILALVTKMDVPGGGHVSATESVAPFSYHRTTDTGLHILDWWHAPTLHQGVAFSSSVEEGSWARVPLTMDAVGEAELTTLFVPTWDDSVASTWQQQIRAEYKSEEFR